MMTEKPRILIIGHGHPALRAGGAVIAAHDLFRGLNLSGQAEASFLGCVAARPRPVAADCAVQSAVQSYDGSPNEYLLHAGDFDRFMLAHGIGSRSLDDFGSLLDTVKPHVVHFHHLAMIGAESLALVRNRLPAARIVFSLHDFHPICHHDGLMLRPRSDALCEQATPDACHACFDDISPGRFALRLQHIQNMLGLVDRFIAPSIFLRQRFDEWGISEHMIDWIPNGLPEAVQPMAGGDRRPRNRFGFFGDIAPHKGPLVALDALRRVDPALGATLTLNGALTGQSSGFRKAFQDALERLGDRVHFAGPYSRLDVAQRMNEVDWVVVPSTWWENAPLIILESFRLGRPVIASDIGGMEELVDHGVNGFLVRRNDAADLAQTMAAAATDGGIWERFAGSLPPVPSMKEIVARHTALYGDLMKHSQRRTA